MNNTCENPYANFAINCLNYIFESILDSDYETDFEEDSKDKEDKENSVLGYLLMAIVILVIIYYGVILIFSISDKLGIPRWKVMLFVFIISVLIYCIRANIKKFIDFKHKLKRKFLQFKKNFFFPILRLLKK